MITITVVSYNNEAVPSPVSLAFGPEGKTLGRSNDNHLVLADPKHLVSRTQAMVKSDGRQHRIMNLSQANPILVNGQEIEPEREYPLQDGDEIRIGLYVLRAEAHLHAVASLVVSNEPAVAAVATTVSGQGHFQHPLEMEHRAATSVSRLPAAETGDKLPPRKSPPAAAMAEGQPSSENVDSQALLDAFLAGAGIPSATISQGLTPEFMEMLGKLLAISVKGTMDLNAQRALVKREVNADVTMVVVRNNNPLKFLSDSETVLIQMFRKKMPGFMSPPEALQDAYDDLHAHQLGVVAGMRAAVNNALKRYDPEALEKAVMSRSVMDALLPTRRKARLWDSFIKSFKKMHVKTQDDFQAIFGKAFLKAYEEEVERHQNEDKNGDRHAG